jgi:hypothetical protein
VRSSLRTQGRPHTGHMVWGLERTVPSGAGGGMPGALAATETTAFFQRLGAAAPVMPVDEERVADVRYEVMTSVPENWIPFVPVHVPGSNRQVQLQRSAMPRIMPGPATEPVQPRTALLREGRDGPGGAQPYFLFEEEVGRAGTVVTQSFQRTRALGGRAVLGSAPDGPSAAARDRAGGLRPARPIAPSGLTGPNGCMRADPEPLSGPSPLRIAPDLAHNRQRRVFCPEM